MSGLGTGLGISLASTSRLVASTSRDESLSEQIGLDSVIGLLATQSGDTLFTQDERNIFATELTRFIVAQTGGHILTESGDLLITD
tara:strand:+ start:378 stop:635 length:258 start_codon:yes stop_codon:yes gene_type:complete